MSLIRLVHWDDIFSVLLAAGQRFTLKHYGEGMFIAGVDMEEEADLTEDEAKRWMLKRIKTIFTNKIGDSYD